jgi:plasmid stabilization system protein ParE
VKYFLSVAARADIRAITHHIRKVQQSPQNARLVASGLKSHFQLLARMPGIGHVREEIDDDSVRVSSVSGLLVFYDPKSRSVEILRVVHPSRDIGRIRLNP